MNNIIINLSGIILAILGYLDGVKYHFQAVKIKQVKTAKGNSRKFINFALGNDIYRLFYFFFIDKNYYVLFSSIVALIFMIELWWNIYIFYPYKYYPKEKKVYLKRPNLWVYFINSLQKNSKRKHL